MYLTVKTQIYLTLDSITVNQHMSSPDTGDIALAALKETLALPTAEELCRINGRVLSLKINIVNANEGCYLTRSSILFAIFGFGNARLHFHASIRDELSQKTILIFSQRLRHTGLNIDSQQYLENNGTQLIKELATIAAYNIGRKTHNTILQKHHSKPLFCNLFSN